MSVSTESSPPVSGWTKSGCYWTMMRRFKGFCFYCGRPSRRDVCGLCDDLPAKDKLVRAPLDQWADAR